MSLLREIQASLLSENPDLSTVLLKLKFLAAKLGSDVLEDWVNHESEGYPNDVEVPSYRKVGVSYTGSFSGSYGRGIENTPIPTAIIHKFAGPKWSLLECRQGIASIEDLMRESKEGSGTLEIDSSDLILMLQGKVYEDYNCYQVTGKVSKSAFADIKHVVKSRALDLTLKLEKSIEGSLEISVTDSPSINESDSEQVEKITNQVIYGNYTNITNSGDSANISVSNGENDLESLKQALVSNGIEQADANELSDIISKEDSSGDKDEPLGTEAKHWFVENLKKAADGTWKIGVTAATAVVKEASLRYYGLK